MKIKPDAIEIQNMLIDKVRECSKCGICRSVCPIFQAVNNEVMSPRGRISLIEAALEGGLSSSERYMDTVRACIRCMRCSDACPVGVRVEQIVQSARDMLSDHLSDEIKEGFRSTLFDSKKFCSALKEKVGKEIINPQIPLWQLPLFFHERAYLAKLADETVLDKYPEYINSQDSKRIALFVGCSVNYSNTDIADSVITVLKQLNIEIFLPKDQLCCGAPLLLYGDREGARELAYRNLKALKAGEFDAVITLCPACGVTLKREYEQIIGSDLADFVPKVKDISEFITDYKPDPIDMSVTYHDPCYLRFGQGVISQPREILRKSARFIEMKDADKCCGLGGALGLFHPEISEKIAELKIKAIVDSGADVVATGCPGCIIFIKDQLARRGIKKDVLHTIQVLEASLHRI